MEQTQLASALGAAWTALLPVLPIWIFGACVGFLGECVRFGLWIGRRLFDKRATI